MTTRRMWKGEPLAENLCDLIDEGRLTLAQARAAADRQRAVDRHRESVERERERQNAEWRARQEEEDRMAGAWAVFVWAHSEWYAHQVIHADYSLRFAVASLREATGCDVGCGHQPVTEGQRQALYALAEREGCGAEKVATILEHAPYLVSSVLASSGHGAPQ